MNATTVGARAGHCAERYDTDAIRRANPLERVARGYGLALARRGAGRFLAFCPFHDDRRTPNLHIDARDPATAHFHCFAGHCLAHGDVIRFVMRMEGLDFRGACAHLGGTTLPVAATGPARRSAPRSAPAGAAWPARRWDRLTLEEQTVMNLAGEVYRRALWRRADALGYLEGRGLPRWVVARCALGWADGRTLAATLRRRGPRPLALALELGLLRRGRRGEPRDALACRVVVPELRSGNCIWFIGRGLSAGGGTPYSDAKYLALPGERPVLGQGWAAGRSDVFACEGVFDWLAALAHHLPSWCPCGTHVSAASLGFLARARRVYGVFDGDEAGRAASARLGQLLGGRYRHLALPEGTDLSDLLRRPGGRAEFDARLAAARRDEPTDDPAGGAGAA